MGSTGVLLRAPSSPKQTRGKAACFATKLPLAVSCELMREAELAQPRHVPTRAVDPREKAAGDGVAHVHKDDRDCLRLPLEGNGRWERVCQDDVGLQADQLLRERSHPNVVAAAPSKVHLHVAAHGPARSVSACVNAERRGFTTGSFSSYGMSTPMRRTRLPCCARAANGQAAAPPICAVEGKWSSDPPSLEPYNGSIARPKPVGALPDRLLHCGISVVSAARFMAEMGHKHRISVLLTQPLCRK